MKAASGEPVVSRLILLGSASSVPSAVQDTTYLVWHGPSTAVLLDCGGSPLQKLQQVGVPLAALRHVILTHRHADHVYGMPVLFQGLWLYGRREPLAVWGPPDALDAVGRVMDVVGWSEWAGMFPVRWQPVVSSAPRVLFAEPDLVVDVTANVHSVPGLAVRLRDRATGGVAVYSSDTEPCDAVVGLAQDADLLVHEATFLEEGGPGHSTAAQAGQVARRAGVGRLVLVHVSPLQDDLEAVCRSAQEMFDGPVELGRDGTVYAVQPFRSGKV